jgi:DNA-binding winged helix-turn-helix (wHTH) protein
MALLQLFSRNVRFGDVTLDYRRRLVMRDGESFSLVSSYWNVLILLIERRPEPVSHEDLAKVLGGSVTSVGKAVQTIRKQLGDSEEKPFIASERGVGYRFVGEVRQRDARLTASLAVGCFLMLAMLAAVYLKTSGIKRQNHQEEELPRKLVQNDYAQIPLVSDGARIYFGEWDNGRFSLRSSVIT